MLSVTLGLALWMCLLACVRAQSISPVLGAFCLGLSIYPVIRLSATSLLPFLLGRQKRDVTAKDQRVYGLEHGVLNIELPTRTMWMNLGYWKDQVAVTNDV